MALTKSRIEHEFLFRWDEQGNPQGCHIAYRDAVQEDGVEIASKFLEPRPVQLEDADKLAEIGAAINTSVLADNARQAAQIAALDAALNEVQNAKAAVEAERDTALNGLTDALAQIEALKAQNRSV